jgi:hypothetical protein
MIAATVVIKSGEYARQAGQDRNTHEAEAAEKRYPASLARSPELVLG